MLNVFRPFAPILANKEVCAYEATSPARTVETLTRDITIKPLHSHNDYWRSQPLFEALIAGCASIESDIWCFEEDYEMVKTDIKATATQKFSHKDIYVGHNQIFLKSEGTLSAMYLDPLFQFLESTNPQFKTRSGKSPLVEGPAHKNGVFYNAPETPLYLWMDFKTDPGHTYTTLMPLLKRFIDRGFLAYYDTETRSIVPGPIVVILTGNLPTEMVKKEPKRYVFLDAPLKQFTAGSKDLAELAALSVVASGSMAELLGTSNFTLNEFDEHQQSTLKTYIDVAHKYNLKTRIWGGVDWPRYIRDAHNRQLWAMGCDLINIDDVAAGAAF